MGYVRFQVSQGRRCYLLLDTTREPRPGEENGKGELGQLALCSGTRRKQPDTRQGCLRPVSHPRLLADYYFVTREVMQRDIAAGDFIEHAEFSGNLYGTRCAVLWAFPSSHSPRDQEWVTQAGGVCSPGGLPLAGPQVGVLSPPGVWALEAKDSAL